MGVEDLLDWIDRRIMNGALTIEWSSRVRSFVFDSGHLISASSSEPGEHVGQILLREGLLDREALGRALEAQAETGGSLSRVLCGMGAVEEEKLRTVLEEQASESLLDTWSWPDGTFVFERADERTNEVDFPLLVRVRPCLVAGRQRMHRWKQIRRFIPSDDLVLQVADHSRLSMAEDSEEELEHTLELVGHVEQGRTIDEIVAQVQGRRFGVMERLALLVERGGLIVSRSAPKHRAVAQPVARGQAGAAAQPGAGRTAASVQELGEAARRQAAGGDTQTALETARQALALDPHRPAIQKLFQDIERTLFAELSRELLTSFRVPRLLVDRARLDDLGLSDTERYLAGRIDGHWDLLSLMRVSPLREVEVLITFKRLADRGIISL